jgi:CRP/FNR family transcriptional regulator, cyclic AMP receptor protein
MSRRLLPSRGSLSHVRASDRLGNQMNIPMPSEAGNQFEAQLLSWKVPPEIVREILEYHSNLNYAPGAMIFCQGAPADIIFWVVKGLVKESCPSPNGSRIMVRLATAGDVIGVADQVNEKGQWIRRFEAQAVNKCVVAMITRQRVRDLLTSLDSATLLEVSERMNSAWSGWVHYYASFLGMSFRERLELMLAQLGRKFGAPDDDGIALTFEPAHGDLAEMIGCSRPMVSRLMADLIAQGEIARRGRLYILLKGGTIAAIVRNSAAVASPPVDLRAPDVAPSGRRRRAA